MIFFHLLIINYDNTFSLQYIDTIFRNNGYGVRILVMMKCIHG
jgi:hypothetical protein